jgi:transposase
MHYIGVDYHKSYSHMTVMDGQGVIIKAGRVENSAEAVHAFVAPYCPGASGVVEATRNWTVIYDLLERDLDTVYLAHPLKVRAIAEARIKTDQIDSRTLAHLLRCDLIPIAHVRPKAQRTAQLILRQRLFFVRLRTMVKNRIHTLIDRQLPLRDTAAAFADLFGTAGRAWLDTAELPPAERQLLSSELALLDHLGLRIAASDAAVKQLADANPDVSLVRTIPGLGPFFAVLVASEVGDIHRFRTPEKLCAYAGLVPSVYASGGKVFHGRLTKQGNKWLRWALVEAATSAIQGDRDLRDYYERLRHRKGANAARVATARRLLTIVYRVLSQERPYELRRPLGRRPRCSPRTALVAP